MPEPLTDEDKGTLYALIAQANTAPERFALTDDQRRLLPGLASRLRDYFGSLGTQAEAYAAVQFTHELRELLEKVVDGFNSLAAAEAERQKRETRKSEAQFDARRARTAALWGPQGLVLGLMGLAGTVLGYLAHYLLGGAP